MQSDLFLPGHRRVTSMSRRQRAGAMQRRESKLRSVQVPKVVIHLIGYLYEKKSREVAEELTSISILLESPTLSHPLYHLSISNPDRTGQQDPLRPGDELDRSSPGPTTELADPGTERARVVALVVSALDLVRQLRVCNGVQGGLSGFPPSPGLYCHGVEDDGEVSLLVTEETARVVSISVRTK